ncbi:MAG: hypothetical protein NTU81_02830 [Candidatus Nomurabacteria bacterium]|nr:hypothetical protein [Candidatus Nomurabacteria bacterium]
MDQETKQLLEENLRLSKDNNVMLNSLVHAKKLNTIYRFVYWSIIILLTIGSYYFIQPYLGTLMSLYSGGATDIQNVGNVKAKLGDQQQIDELLKQLKEN